MSQSILHDVDKGVEINDDHNFTATQRQNWEHAQFMKQQRDLGQPNVLVTSILNIAFSTVFHCC
jgi:hypothetical protein